MDLLQRPGGQRMLIAAAPVNEEKGVIELELSDEELVFNPDGPDPLGMRGRQLDIPEDARDRLAFGFGGQPVIFGEAAPLPVVGISMPGGYSFNVLEQLGYDMQALRAGRLCDQRQALSQPSTARRHEERPRFRNSLSPTRTAVANGRQPPARQLQPDHAGGEPVTRALSSGAVAPDIKKRKHKKGTTRPHSVEKTDPSAAITRQMIFQALGHTPPEPAVARHRPDRLDNDNAPLMTSRRKVHRRVTASPEMLCNNATRTALQSESTPLLLRAGMRRIAAEKDVFGGSDPEARTESKSRKVARRRQANTVEDQMAQDSLIEQMRRHAAAIASLGLAAANSNSSRRAAARRFASESPVERQGVPHSSRMRERDLPGVFVGGESPKLVEKHLRRLAAKKSKASSKVARQSAEAETAVKMSPALSSPVEARRSSGQKEATVPAIASAILTSKDGAKSIEVKITEDGQCMIPIGLSGQVQMRPLAQSPDLPGAMSEGLIPTTIEETTILHPQVGAIGPDGKATLKIDGLVLPLQDPDFMKQMMALGRGEKIAPFTPPTLHTDASPRVSPEPPQGSEITKQKALAAEIARQLARSTSTSPPAAFTSKELDATPVKTSPPIVAETPAERAQSPPTTSQHEKPPESYEEALRNNKIKSIRLRPPNVVRKFMIAADDDTMREVEVVTVCEQPNIQLMRDLLSIEECDEIDHILQGIAARPDVPNNLLGSELLSGAQEDRLMRVVRRMAALSGLNEDNFEGLCPSEISISSGDSTADFNHIIRLYLDEPHAGYTSDFLNLGISLFPRRGSAIRWTCRAENGRRYELAAHKESIAPPNSRRMLTAYVA